MRSSHAPSPSRGTGAEASREGVSAHDERGRVERRDHGGRGGEAAILLPSFAAHDAVGHDTLGLRDSLRDAGFAVRVFAGSSAAGLGGESVTAARPWLRRGVLAIYQQSTGWREGERLLAAATGPIVVRDHAVTPQRFFAASDAQLRAEVAAGEGQRGALARDPRVTRFLATSACTARELVALGAPAERIAVVPPFSRVEHLADVAPDEAALRRFAARPADVLFVGRVAPNKGQHRVQRIAGRYAVLFGDALRVRLVGKVDLRHLAYDRQLRRERAELGLEGRVQLLGEVTEAELKASYLTSRVFLCCSEHEGFCVPLVEAAWLGVPILAAHQDAVADTLGRRGFVLPADAGDDLFAVALRRLLQDAELRDRLVEAQRADTYERFSRAALAARLGAALAPIERSLVS
jgi:glycosyltransferase involved in cell wall biosynthesis